MLNRTLQASEVEDTISLMSMRYDVCSKPGTPRNHNVANGFETHPIIFRLNPGKPLMEWGPVFAKMVTPVSFLDHLLHGHHLDVLAMRLDYRF